MQVIWNGDIVDEQNIPLSLTSNRGFRYGEGFFETIRIHNKQAPLLEFHWQRICEAALKFNFSLPFDFQKIKNDIFQVCDSNNIDSAVVRLNVFREGSGNYLVTEINNIHYGISIRHFQFSKGKTFEQSGCLDHILFSKNKFAPFKTFNALPYLEMSKESKERNWDTGIALNENGIAVDACWHSFALIAEGKILFPNQNNGGVHSCSAAALQHLLLQQNRHFHFENLTVNDLDSADEIFFLNAIDGVVPLLSWNQKKLSISESEKLALDYQSFYYF